MTTVQQGQAPSSLQYYSEAVAINNLLAQSPHTYIPSYLPKSKLQLIVNHDALSNYISVHAVRVSQLPKSIQWSTVHGQSEELEESEVQEVL